MDFSITLLLVVVLFPNLSVGLICYSCYPEELNSNVRCKENQEILQQQCSHSDTKRTFCLVERAHPDPKTIYAGCSWEYYHNLIPKRTPLCDNSQYENETDSKVILPSKRCVCKADLCNTYSYAPAKLYCWSCDYSRSPFDHTCNDDETEVVSTLSDGTKIMKAINLTPRKCLLDEDICVYQTKPRLQIGCSRRSKYQKDKGDVYSVTEEATCLSNHEHTLCLCQSPLCNTFELFHAQKKGTNQTIKNMAAMKSLPLVIILLMPPLTLFRPWNI